MACTNPECPNAGDAARHRAAIAGLPQDGSRGQMNAWVHMKQEALRFASWMDRLRKEARPGASCHPRPCELSMIVERILSEWDASCGK